MIIDESNRLALFSSENPRKIELGCGHHKKSADHIGIDMLDTAAADIVGDAVEVLRKIPDRSVSEIFSSHFAEHVDDLEVILNEARRVLVDGGTMITVAPHFSNPYFYSDPTHRRFFGLYTFSYYCRDEIFRRQVPAYRQVEGLSLVSVDLVFRAARPHYFSHAIRKVFGFFFNASNFMKEIYENSFTSVLSCYEISYLVRKS
jgi:ubiquinone/menaquinone biosynthesis C-methylase UbiE